MEIQEKFIFDTIAYKREIKYNIQVRICSENSGAEPGWNGVKKKWNN